MFEKQRLHRTTPPPVLHRFFERQGRPRNTIYEVLSLASRYEVEIVIICTDIKCMQGHIYAYVQVYIYICIDVYTLIQRICYMIPHDQHVHTQKLRRILISSQVCR